jgi:hypothetical protein
LVGGGALLGRRRLHAAPEIGTGFEKAFSRGLTMNRYHSPHPTHGVANQMDRPISSRAFAMIVAVSLIAGTALAFLL